jgi:predicted ATPase/class 3 adenylate cyclase
MADRPNGVLTLLFTDIEGSTGILQKLGDGYIELLSHHHRLLRDAFERHRGYEVDAAGDGFFVVFPTPEDALGAALYGQRALTGHAWSEGVELRVRMGLHTGDPIWTSVGYVGLHVHRAARISSTAHGSQVVLSKACAELVREPFRNTLTFRDLGEHHLEGLLDPEQIFQAVVADLPSDFPPLRSRSVRAKKTRPQLAPIIGRSGEIEELSNMLSDPNTRLVTLQGTGGTGKTRLALELASCMEAHFANGVHFVDLAPIEDPARVAQTIAASIGLRTDVQRDPAASLIEFLAPRRTLIVLDNFERVVDAAELLLDVLTRCPLVVFLVTSRVALRLRIERGYPLAPLAVPKPQAAGDAIAASPAVALFLERARATDPWFDASPSALQAVAAICRALDGLPLAIELAAARVALVSAEDLLPMLEHRLDMLTDGARDLPARQRRLRDCIAWSYDALDVRDQALLRALSVFRGGFTIDAADAVCAIEGDSILGGVTSLMNQSLLRRESVEDGKPRLGLLGTIADFGREQLVAAAEESAARLRHADYYRRAARIAEPKLAGESQFRELARLESELENIRAALDWGLQEPSASDVALDLAASLLMFWWHRYIGEGSRRLQQLLDVPANKNSRHRARALAHASFLSIYEGNAATCERLARESVELCRGFARPTGTLSTGLGLMARVASSRGEHAVALASAAESVAVARALGGGFPLNIALGALGDVAFATDDRVLAEASWNESVEGFRRLGEKWLIAAPLARLGSLAVRRGDPERARRLFEESVGLWRAAGNGAGTPQAIAGVGRLAVFEGDWTRAAATSRESLLLAQQLGSRGEYCWGLAGIAEASVAAGNYETACKLFAAADVLGRAAGHSMHSFFEHEFVPSLGRLRNSIDAARYAVLTDEGAALSPAQAIVLALDSVH